MYQIPRVSVTNYQKLDGLTGASHDGSEVKNPPEMQEMQVQSLGWEDSLEEGMATHSNIIDWRIPMDRGAQWVTVHGISRSQTQLK